ncbi:MAG: hypothetical protein RSC05_12910 [Acinetobacter sp.]
MKHRFLATLLLIISLLLLLNVVHAENKALRDLALDYLESETQYLRSQVESLDCYDADDGVYAFTFSIIQHPSNSDGLIICIVNSNGELISIEGPTEISLSEELGIDLKKCWLSEEKPCYQMLYETVGVWKSKVSMLDAASPAQTYDKYVQVTQLHFVMPEENWLVQEEAWAKALTYLNNAGISKEMAEQYEHIINACYIPVDIGKAVWYFYFTYPSFIGGEYDRMSENEIDTLVEKTAQNMTHLWGSSSYPRQFSILVDAVTGDLIEAPILDYAPVQYHYLDFLIRPDFLLSNIGK